MSAHSFIEIDQGIILACREEHVPDLAALFTEEELQDEGERYGYASSVGQMRDRLRLHGYSAQRSLGELEAAVSAWHGSLPDPDPGFAILAVPLLGAAEILDSLRKYLSSADPPTQFDLPDDVQRRLDPRAILRLALDVTANPHAVVRYNLDELASRRLLPRGTPITDQARETRREKMARDAPLVILTEGSDDAQLLAEAVKVTHPHLVSFLRFMDFGSGAEGSAGNLAKLIRSFVAAGIANRVLAIADNDTGAYDALDSLKKERLPDGYRIRHYPALPLLANYPTLGPQIVAPVPMDVNGTAGALEMYLGQELLTVNGELVPVQWQGYVDGQKKYQGAISPRDKARVKKAFRKKAKDAIQDPAVRTAQDWSGVAAIVEEILSAFE